MMLNAKSAIVTGSTSGIGLAIARALGGAGCNVVLNGLGEAAAAEALRPDIEAQQGVRPRYDTAGKDRGHGAGGSTSLWRRRYPRQQPRDPACRPIEELPPAKWTQSSPLTYRQPFMRRGRWSRP